MVFLRTSQNECIHVTGSVDERLGYAVKVGTPALVVGDQWREFMWSVQVKKNMMRCDTM